MSNKKERKEIVKLYLTEEEKLVLKTKADVERQGLSRYVRNHLLKRVNKAPISKEIIAKRILLSEIKSSLMLITTITKGNNDVANRDRLLDELQNLINIVDTLIIDSMGCQDSLKDEDEN